MYTIAYKWRLSTTRYAYITSTQYRVDGSEPDYTLAQIPATGKLDDATEQIIKDIVRKMSADEYRQCFEYMVEKIANDKDGQYIKLKNWEYYYHFKTNENGDEKVFFVDATASATISNDGEAHAEVVNDRGTLKFTFQIPQGVNGRDGVDGKDGAPGVPVNDGKYLESIYKLTTTDNAPLIKLDDDWDIEGSEYQTNDYIPNGWTDRPSGITSIYKYEWVSTRKYDLVKKLWGEFSKPAMMSRWGEDGKDGDGIEYVYIRTIDEVNPGAPKIPERWMDMDNEYQTNDEYAVFLKEYGWTDEPVGTEKNGYKFEWVSVRKQKDGVWQQFSKPALWSSYGKDGDDVEYIYFLNNDNEVPSFDDYQIDSDEYQSEDFRPTTSGVLWTDNYQSPTYEKRFSWISSRRKRDGKWLDFTGTSLFNVYKIGGKAYVDLYTRSNTRIDHHNLPSYDGNIYYSFNSDRFYNDDNLTSEITAVNGLNNTVWYTDMPADNTAKMLFKTSALIEIKDNYDEVVAIPQNLWYGPYLISSNGENATNQTPYINLNDNSLPLPINEENKPHKEYLHSLIGKLLVNDDEAEITEANITTSSDKNIKINENIINKDTNEFHLKFTINKDEEFTNIGIIYITLKGLYEDKEVIATTQYKIVPFYSDNAVTYKMLLNQNSVFVPDNACEILPDGGIWNTQITAHVIDDKGEDVTVGDLLYEYETNKYVSFKDNDNPEGITGTLKLIGCNNEEYLANGYKLIQSLPNPLRLIYEINGKTLEIGYVDFNNIPKDGKNGISTRTIFAYCSTEEGITPNTPKDGGVDFTSNTVTYPNGVDVNGNDVIWGSSIPLTGIVWLSTCEFSSDTFSGLWSTPIRLTGFKGAAGVSAYHLELTNDMDQVYTTDDNVVIKNQKVETIVSILNGNTPMYITADNIKVTSVNGFKVSKVNVKDDSTNTEVKITFELIGTTLTAKTINFNISIDGDNYGTTNYDFVKTFKIKNLNGTIDYDLDVSPTFIKKNKNKQYSESAITVNITERDIATDSKTVTTLTSFTEGLSITYFYNNDSDRQNDLETLGDKIPVTNVDGYNDEINKITINLYKQGEPIDQVFVECVSDGIDGSAYHLELTNEYEQLYVTDNKVVFNQTAETNYTLFNGVVDANDDISTITVTIDGGRECKIENYDVNYTGKTTSGITITPKDKKVSIVFNTGEIFNKRDIKAKFSIKTKNGVSIEKILKIIVLNGTKDYDLVVQPTYLKLDKYGKLANSSITVSVSERDITTTNSTIKLLESLPSNDIKVKYYIKNYDKNLTSDTLNYDTTKVINVGNNIEYAIIELLSGESQLDYVKIETLKDGKDGIDGLSQIVDLSNDYDQLYVTNGLVVENQTIDTIVRLTNGLKNFNIGTSDINIYLDNEIVTSGVTKTPEGDGVKLVFNFNSGVKFEKNELIYTINVTYNGHTFKKSFKIIILNGTKDYDLDINPTIVRKDKHGNYIPSSLTLNIIESNISTTNRNSTKIGVLPTDYTLQYFVDNVNHGTPYTLNGINSEFNFEVLKPNSYIRFELNSGDTPIDYAIVECVSDGVDGSAYHLELSNEFDQVYTINKEILPGQTGITTTVQLFNGTQSASISDLAVTNFDGISTTGISGNTVSISFNEGAKTEEKEYVYKISGKTPEGDDIEKDFKIIVLNGNKDYDLHSTHTYVKKYGDNIIDTSITITVLESIIGTNDRSETTLNSLPEGMEIEVFVDGNELTDISYNSGITLNLASYSLQYQIVVNLLFKNDPDPIDSIVIEVIKDGKDGVDGKSPYHIELSNDMDQVLTVDGIVKYEQEVSTILSLYYGSSKDTGLTINNIDLPKVDGFTITGETVGSGGDVKINIKPNTGATLEVGKNYEFPIGINQDKTNLNFNIEKLFKTVVLNTSIDYDLFVSNGMIKKTVNGYDTTQINIKVKKTDISRGDRSITYLTNLDNTNLNIKIFKDNNLISTPTYDEKGITLDITALTPNTNILVQLYKKNDNNGEFTPIDESIIEVVSDGQPGQDGTNIEFIYKLFKDEADLRKVNNIFPNDSRITGKTREDVISQLNTYIKDDSIPQWSDSPCGITKDYKIEVSSQRIKELGAENWGAWSDAFIWSKWGEDGIDGDGVEYIFQITNRGVNPTNPGGDIKSILSGYTDSTLSALTEIVNTFDFFPGEEWFETNKEYVTKLCINTDVTYDDVKNLFDLNWSDNPSDVGPYEPLEWVSIRRKKVNLDGTFEYIYTDPTIWAEWKRDTYNSLTEFMFTIYDSRVDLSKCTVTGCTWKDVKDGSVYSGVTTLSGKTVLDIEWQDSVPNHNMFTQSVWMVKGFASGEIEYTGDANRSGITYSEIEWTSPTKLIDNQHMQVEYGIGIKDNMGQLVVPKPINLQDIVNDLDLNYDYTTLEKAFREKDADNRPDFQWTDNPTGESPTWMITSTFYNGKWSDWVVSKIKGEKGETGETGQSIQIKGSFETIRDLQNAYKYFKKQISEKPSKYFNDEKLEIGDSYIVNESIVDGEKVFGYLYVFVKDDENFEAAWESVGQIKGESSFIYIAYASSVTIDNSNIKTYHLTEGGIINNENYYGTTPGKYIGIHVATQQYEGHPYPPKLYSSSSVTETSNTFLWNKWEGEDGFGQEQIFILSGETAPKVPVYSEDSTVTSITEWNRNDFVPNGWSDVPLTTSGSDNERCCWMATRRFPVKDNTIPNEFVGESGKTGTTAILFSYYASDGNDGESPIHVELSNEMEQIYTIDNMVNITQRASTIVTVYSGSTPITEFNVNGIDVTNGEYIYTKVYNSGTTFSENEEKIEIKVTVNDIDITRYFKVVKLNGTKDYDLVVTPTYLRVDKKNNVIYNNPITVEVVESEIGSTNVAKKTIDIANTGLKVKYTYDRQTKENSFIGGNKNFISVTAFSNYCKIWLVNGNGDTLDSVQVEKLYDGIDGQPGASGQSPFHIELSNEFDLISVIDGKVNGDQTYTTSFELWEGDVDRTKTITSITINNVPGKEFTKTGSGITGFTIEFNNNDILSNTIYGDLKVKTTNGKLHHRTFTIKPINDSIIHQLQVDKGYVVNGENSSINISAVTKTNSGVILMSDNIDKKIEIKEGSKTLTATTNTYTYKYSGGTNDIVINLYINDEIYDYVLIEAKNDIKPSGTLNINPISQVVYVEKIEGTEDKYKPLVSSVTFDASFVYEGSEKPLTGVNISVGGSANDFSKTPVISDYGIEVKYLDKVELTTENLTKERYVFETKYGNDTYYNNFFITYVEPQLDVWVDGDCIYIPDDYKGDLSKEFIFEAKFENSNVTRDCEIKVEGYTGITFNLRNNSWYINIPSGVTSVDEITGFTINFTYNGISTSKEVTIIRRGKNSENWYINVFPKYLSINVGEPINLYITKNNYNGEYISLENALDQNMKLYYIIDGECVNVDENGNETTASGICYSNNLKYAPKEHGNNVFYPNGCLITSITTSVTDNNVVEEITITGYTQEPIYSSIEFKLYYEPDNNIKELVASEKVERFDVIRNGEPTRMPASGLKIDIKDLFEDYDSKKYDIVIKEIKK